MFIAALEFGGLFLLLATHLLAGFALGWFVRGVVVRRRRVKPPTSGPNGDRPESDPWKFTVCQSLLDDIDAALATHGGQLDRFTSSLESASADGRPAPESALSTAIDAIRSANAQVLDILTDRMDRLARFAKPSDLDAIEDGVAGLDRYRKASEQHQEMLAQLPPDTVIGLVDRLLEETRALRQENQQLHEQLDTCRQQLVTEASRTNAARAEARIDVLTQLPNRRAFEEKVSELISFVERHGHPFSLVLFDLDHFKSVNDRHGHTAGDAVLAMLGRILADSRRGTDHVSRFGGEEFVLLIPRCGIDQATLIAERYRKRIAGASLVQANQALKVTASAGVAEFDLAETTGSLLARADAALYASKRAGGNRTHRHDGTESAAIHAAVSS